MFFSPPPSSFSALARRALDSSGLVWAAAAASCSSSHPRGKGCDDDRSLATAPAPAVFAGGSAELRNPVLSPSPAAADMSCASLPARRTLSEPRGVLVATAAAVAEGSRGLTTVDSVDDIAEAAGGEAIISSDCICSVFPGDGSGLDGESGDAPPFGVEEAPAEAAAAPRGGDPPRRKKTPLPWPVLLGGEGGRRPTASSDRGDM